MPFVGRPRIAIIDCYNSRLKVEVFVSGARISGCYSVMQIRWVFTLVLIGLNTDFVPVTPAIETWLSACVLCVLSP
jgi:hypothetical protein